ncbi:MAG TPA: TonB-dependent receptor, partial [Bacteroidales bacterium]|nr:TonB-dependent receptor [Bacteroidales bacterium]
MIRFLPTLAGERDIIRSLQLLPGIQAATEATTGLVIRGGSPDQNLFLLDGSPIYNISHLYGFLSVFNDDAINTVDVIKGGFPARFGGRLSSIVDV